MTGKAAVASSMDSAAKIYLPNGGTDKFAVQCDRDTDYGRPIRGPDSFLSDDEVAGVPACSIDKAHMQERSEADSHFFEILSQVLDQASILIRGHAVGAGGNKASLNSRDQKRAQESKASKAAELAKIRLVEHQRKEKEEQDRERNVKRDHEEARGKWLCHECEEDPFTDGPHPQDTFQPSCFICGHWHLECERCLDPQRLVSYFRAKRENREQAIRAARAEEY
ncbi:uncharacterized protein RSE6_04984 [Rhynchosporium secalis]|uniref:Uncharacterized protein n=1 Tax=Rhynchosporium secalis TaxID=38038 RepID=A0A1E1M6N4_RHYSE|nr:uncharacterized protein RSE6_04984 [Rhynchosporium secalis]